MRSIQRWQRFLGLVLAGGAALAVAGCGVGAQLEECQTRLTATEAERDRLDLDLVALRDDYKEVLRSFAVTPTGESVTAEMRSDVEQQIEVVKSSVADQVPPLVREQLEKELASLLATLDQQFGRVDVQYTRIATRLDEVRGSLDIANERLEGIEVSGEGLRREISEQRIDVARLEEEVEKVAASIEVFDESYLLCRDCAEYLDIKPKRAEPILSLHADLKSALRRLPTLIAGVEAGFDGDDPAAPATEGAGAAADGQ
jgi:chromosome segregation ATPase